jgi:hypothetical protein
MAEDKLSGQGGARALMKRIVARHGTVLAVGLLLIVAGLLAVARGLILIRAGTGLQPATSLPTRMEERLIPTAISRKEITVAPSRLPTDADPDVVPVSETSPASTASVELMPTRVPTRGEPGHALTVAVTGMPTANPTPLPAPIRAVEPCLFTPGQRIGFVAPMADVGRYDAAWLGAGWYLSCLNGENPLQPAGIECAELVVVMGDGYRPAAASLQDMARRNPGRLWLVGNEPDVIWQGNATPQEYARVYHEIYQLLKAADPSCQVAIGGVSQVTPLRLRYLEEVLAAYEADNGQPMPVDVWNIHVAILREERDSWGVDIPPGLPDDSGILYQIQDNADVEILKKQVVTFRHWMADRGLRDRPLIVTEFSVLMPPDYGFPFERVRDFMLAAAEYFMTATDGNLGYAADGNRLVQRWAWYSIADETYYTGNLFDPETGLITPLGQVFARYAANW